MTQDITAETASTPVSDQTIRTVAERHDLPENDVRRLLDQVSADVHDNELRSELDELYEFKGVSRGVRVYLCDHGLQIDQMADHAAALIDAEFPAFAQPPAIVRMAFDHELKKRHYDVVGGEQSAVDAVGTSDALLIHDD